GVVRLLAEVMQLFQRLSWHIEAVAFGASHFDDVPLSAGTRLAQAKDFFVKIAVEGFLLAFFDVNGPGPPRKLLEHGDGITAPRQTIANIHLHIDLGPRASKQDFPG